MGMRGFIPCRFTKNDYLRPGDGTTTLCEFPINVQEYALLGEFEVQLCVLING